MKKIVLLALLFAMGASLNTTEAKKKKENKPTTAPLVLQNANDSISYATGIEMTNGLIPYLISQRGVDTTYLYKFIEGFEAAISKETNHPELNAYAAGVDVAHMVSTNMLATAKRNLAGVADSLNIDAINQGFLAALKKDYSTFTDSAAQRYVKDRKEQHILALKKEGEEFLKQTAKQPGVTTQPSGLQYRVLRQGTGPIATANDQVEVKYEGRLVDGTIFDSSYKRNPQTTTFRPTDVIKGWTEALTMMPEGSMWELYIPYNLAYGERDMGEIKPYSTLIFRVEVEKVIKAEEKKTDTPSANSPAPTPQKKVTTRKPATIKK